MRTLAGWNRSGMLGLLLMACCAMGPRPAHAQSEPAAHPERSAASQAQFDALTRARAAVVGVRTTAVEDARSIDTLGRDRRGSGVVIGNDGLVVTIGYLIVEADHVEIELPPDHVVPARVVGYDLASGFGLLQPLVPLRVAPAKLGSAAAVSADEPMVIISGGTAGDVSLAYLVSRRPFTGYWEYHLDSALFTAPPRADHSGAALFSATGELLGIGSLVVMNAAGSDHPQLAGNMFVPVDLLKAVLPEMRLRGATRGSTRAWLGVNCAEVDGQIHVLRITPDSPAEAAGLLPGDVIMRIDGTAVGSLEAFYKTLWRGNRPEREVTLVISRDGVQSTVRAQAQDRMKTWRRPKGI